MVAGARFLLFLRSLNKDDSSSTGFSSDPLENGADNPARPYHQLRELDEDGGTFAIKAALAGFSGRSSSGQLQQALQVATEHGDLLIVRQVVSVEDQLQSVRPVEGNIRTVNNLTRAHFFI